MLGMGKGFTAPLQRRGVAVTPKGVRLPATTLNCRARLGGINCHAVRLAPLTNTSFSLTTTTGHRVMASPLPAPTASTVKAPKPKCSPPSPEELCLWTFHACWYLDKDWLVSFVASTQCMKPDSPITWVEFMPKGHMHLVRSALKLVPVTKNLPLAKI